MCHAIRRASSAQEGENLWKVRKSIGGVIAGVTPNFLVEDVTVPMSRVSFLLLGIEAIAEKHGIQIISFGHAGDGNFHPHFLYDAGDREQADKVERAVKELFRLTCELGGTLSGEHGIGLAKAPFMILEHDPVAMEMMASLKRTFDPKNILNPGKMGLEA